MNNQLMCKTCKSVVVERKGLSCDSCWEVEHRIQRYVTSANGLRKVMAVVQAELSNPKHLDF